MNKKDKLAFYASLMVISGVFGWIYEVIFYYINSGFKTVYMRGIVRTETITEFNEHQEIESRIIIDNTTIIGILCCTMKLIMIPFRDC